MGKNDSTMARLRAFMGRPSVLVFLMVLAGVVAGVLLWKFQTPSSMIFQWLLAILPGTIILTQLVFLLSSRKKQYRDALSPMVNQAQADKLEDLYFGTRQLTFRFVAPAILVTVLCATIISALVDPYPYLPWLYRISSPAAASSTDTPGSADAANSGKSASASHDNWPQEGWTLNILRGSALGFLGAYVYLLLMLTDRARQRDITTGIATWAAAMPVLGLLMEGVAALIVSSALGTNDTSWTHNAIFFVAGMLPRQFASYVLLGVQRMFQQGATPTVRTLPLATLRGVGLDVQARLEEEGIHDVSALAYVSPHALIRLTTYSPRQIVDWIDEALLVATVPEYWEALERAGVTGALDLAWYEDHQEAIADLAKEIKMEASLLTSVVIRLSQDAQVEDLHQLYWDKTAGGGSAMLNYRFAPGSSKADRTTLVTDILLIRGVSSVDVVEDKLYVDVTPSQREAVDIKVRGMTGIAAQG